MAPVIPWRSPWFLVTALGLALAVCLGTIGCKGEQTQSSKPTSAGGRLPPR